MIIWRIPSANYKLIKYKQMKKKILVFLSAFFLSLITFAQETEQVEMADEMRASGKIYVVVAVLVTVFIGIVIYLIRIDRKVSKLEKEVKK